MDEMMMNEIKESEGESQSQSLSEPQFYKITQELQDILEAHQKWLATKGKSGQQADLSGYDFQGLDLTGANLLNTKLQGANFTGANLLRADFRDANLEDADLSQSKNLLGSQLGGTVLSRAMLPEQITEFTPVEKIAEVAKYANPIFYSILLTCVYLWLTIATTKDADLLALSTTTSLPIIGGKISIAGFYWFGSLLLIALYFYLHLSLQQLWVTLAILPAIFTDGRRIDQVVYPWLFNWLVLPHFSQLRDNLPVFYRLKLYIPILLAWAFVPLTLIAMCLRYLSRHDWTITLIQIALIITTLWFAMTSLYWSGITIEGRTLIKERKKIIINWITPLGGGLLLLVISFGVIHADFDKRNYDIRRLVPLGFNMVGFRPYVANFIGSDISTKPANWNGSEIASVTGASLAGVNLRYAKAARAFLVNAILIKTDLREADLSRADLRGAEIRSGQLQKANLEGAHLAGADLYEAKLNNARLYGANLQNTMMMYTDLTEAELQKVNLQGADLTFAKLNNANGLGSKFQGAKIDGAQFVRANLRGANFEGARVWGSDFKSSQLNKANFKSSNLRAVHLEEAFLDGADFQEADLQGAYLFKAKGITKPQITVARNWILAHYDQNTIELLGLTPDHEERVKKEDFSGLNLRRINLHGADIQGQDFQRTDLEGADLQNANLLKTKLQGANLKGANLQGARPWAANLEGAVLREANLRGAFLQEANLKGADLTRADLRGADLRQAIGLTKEQLNSAIIDDNTQL
jgi:uncharacterized protein YjbI with pentapeptide repeats